MSYTPTLEDFKTAFGEQLVAQLSPQFVGSFEYTVDNTEIISNTEVNTGTVTQSTAMAVCATGSTTGSSAELKSVHHAKYRAGLGGLIRFTGRFTTGVAGTEQFIGLADEAGSSESYENGFMIGYDGDTFGVHRFVNDVLVTIDLDDCDDPLDGSGASGMTFVPTNINVFEIRFQYLGAGAIQYCIEDDDTGKFVVFHTILYANNFTVPSVYNPNFHFTIWANNGATTNEVITRSASYCYFIEGKTDIKNVHQPQQSSGTVNITGVTSEVALFTIRNKSTYVSKTNFIDTILEFFSVNSESSSANNTATIRLVKNATLGGSPSYSDINASNSIMDMDTAGTTVANGKELISLQMAGKNDRVFSNIKNFDIFLHPSETLTMAVSSSNNAAFNGSILWKESF